MGASAALGGCVEQALKAAETRPPPLEEFSPSADVDLPVHEQVDAAVEAVLDFEGEAFADREAFESAVEEGAGTVESLEAVEDAGDPVLELTYVPRDAENRGLMPGLGAVAGAYAALVDGGAAVRELTATLHTPDGDPFGEFEVLTEWAREYLEGGLTAAEYVDEVAHTVESTD